MPKPDGDGRSIIAGAQHRFGCATPKPNKGVFRKFRQHVMKFMRTNFRPLDDLNDDVEEWLDTTSYSANDKLRLVEAFKESPEEVWRFAKKACGSFKKDEFYEEMKPLRVINARQDFYKVFFGPLIKRIEEEVFKHPSFIKKVPIRERPAYIKAIMDSRCPIIVEGDDAIFVKWFSDYTAYESLFTPELMDTCENALFSYMLGGGKWAQQFLSHLKFVTQRMNVCRFRSGVTVQVMGRRMSGEMWTSLGNGFTNLCVLSFLLEEYHSRGIALTPWHFEQLGLRAKLGRVFDVSEASFCGMVFDPDEEIVIRDPRPVLMKLGWTKENYSHASDRTRTRLLRLKALSLAYEASHCPILWAVAKRLLELTRVVAKDMWLLKYCSRWEKEWFVLNHTTDVNLGPPGPKTRMLFESLYGITERVQLEAERIALTMTLGPAPVVFRELLGIDQRFYDFYDNYVSPDPSPPNLWSISIRPLESFDRYQRCRR